MRVKVGFKSTHVPDEIKFGYAIKIHKIMVLENFNFQEAEKKFIVPEFQFLPSDFPTLNNRNVPPTVREQVNVIVTSSFPVSSIFHSKRKTPKRSNAKPYVAPPRGEDIYRETNRTGPVLNQPVYLRRTK